jgi:hypothetical protein
MMKKLALPAGYKGYYFTAPDGARVCIAAYPESALAARIAGLWEAGAIDDFGRRLAREVESYLAANKGNCHALAYTFAFDLIASIGELYPPLAAWQWCIAKTTARGMHSWIEHEGEAFDTSILSANGELRPVIHVHTIAECRKLYEPRDLESRPLLDFARWLVTPERSNLFQNYPDLSARFSIEKQRAWDAGRIQVHSGISEIQNSDVSRIMNGR